MEINMKKEKEQSSSEEQKAANENLLIRLNQNYGKLSKGQKRLADFITAHYDQAVSMTAARLGQQVGVSESTTVRFAMQLGYAGYPEFQRALEEMVMNRLNSVQRMQFTYGRVPQGEILETVLQSDIEKIKMTLEEVMEVMISGEKQEKKVVRLHTGDPCLYGAIKEQMDLLEKENISYKVCPGVSSFCGAASALNAEYTSWDFTVCGDHTDGRKNTGSGKRIH